MYLLPQSHGATGDDEEQTNVESLAKPPEVHLDGDPSAERFFAETSYSWKASNLFSNPLYFEDAPLERYGHSHWVHLQPIVSAGYFSTQLIGLPYQMTIDPVHRKMHALGWYRPGEQAPLKCYQVPISLRAIAVQGAAVTGLIFLLP